jgi:hypothetical protein
MENGEIMKRPIKVPTKAPFIRAAGLIPLFLESANICTPFMSWENRDNLLILQNFYQYVNDSLEDEKIRRGSKINPIPCYSTHLIESVGHYTCPAIGDIQDFAITILIVAKRNNFCPWMYASFHPKDA